MNKNKYRTRINNLIKWEWNTLKQLRRERRRNYLLRVSFAIFSLGSILFCVFAPPFILGSLVTAFRAPWPFVNWVKLISLISWLWFIAPINNFKRLTNKQKKKKKSKFIKKLN
tara:strand:- start:165 stop:503 length:339 start_codon:yes stop_codon:yes gene_type:complete